MALWLLRGGRHGEDVPRFISENKIFTGWTENCPSDLSKAQTKEEMTEIARTTFGEKSKMSLALAVGILWSFVKKMKPGDWVVIPHKSKAAVAIAEIKSDYIYDPASNATPRHYRRVEWIETDVPRSAFDQDLLYSFGGLQTIYQIKKNDAELRIRTMAKKGWKPFDSTPLTEKPEDSGEISFDLEQLARDNIAKLVISRFKGHGLARLVDAILRAQGYTTHVSQPGPDKGVDILAALGPLGFGKPRICVQVKSTDGPVDSPTLNQLIGTMQNVQAEQGLLVSWGGFKSSINKEIPAQFFRVRLWDQDELLNEMLSIYDKLDEDFRAEIPVKRIWTVTSQEGEE